MSNNLSPTPMDKLVLGFVTVMAALMLFAAGTDLEDDPIQSAMSIVSGLFFVGVAHLVVANCISSIRRHAEAEKRDLATNTVNAVEGAINRALSDIERKNEAGAMALNAPIDPAFEQFKHEQYLTEMLEAIIKDVLGGRHDPNKEDLARIEQLFHDNTGDHYVRLTATPEGFGIEFNNEPFPADENPSKAPEKAPGNKPLTKAQQRRINSKKGFGLVTDEELKEQRNARRRATRAANKAKAEAAKAGQKPTKE